jgi:hypothetical protein
MSKWIMNFYKTKVGDQKDIELLTQKGKLNNGKQLSYALGISTDPYKGWKQYSHGGGDAGYRTYITTFPDLKMGFIIFSNVGDLDAGGKTYAIADLFIKDTTQKEEAKTKPRDSTAAILKDTLSVKKYVGDYFGEEGLAIGFYLKQSKLYYHIYGDSNYLIKEPKDTFSMINNAFIKFAFAAKGKDTTVVIVTPDEVYNLKKYIKDTTQTDNFLKQYTGMYECPELDCKYGIELKNHRLVLTNAKYDDAKLTLIGTDDLSNNSWWISHLKVLRSSKKAIIGFEVNNGRIMHLRFNKIR